MLVATRIQRPQLLIQIAFSFPMQVAYILANLHEQLRKADYGLHNYRIAGISREDFNLAA